MKKIEFERLLMTPEGFKLISERAAQLKENFEEFKAIAESGEEKIVKNTEASYDIPQTDDEVKMNDEDVVFKSELVPDITLLIERFRDADPRASLKMVAGKYKDESLTVLEQLELESFINRITSTEYTDKEQEKLIEDAINILISSPKIGGVK